ncbi:hypothetical protein BGX38DRAFT_1261891 [Terfezia claveryi]|nr:hypothetical protein BGX38DRAFT_1261891 [Terfezia claveryi]
MTVTTIIVPIHPDDQSHDLRAPSIPKKRFKCHLFRYGYIRRAGRHSRPSFHETVTNPTLHRTHPPTPSPPAKQHLHTLTTDNWRWISYTCSCCYLPEPRRLAMHRHELHVAAKLLSARHNNPNPTPESRRWGSISVGFDLRPQECWGAENGMRVCGRGFKQGEEGEEKEEEEGGESGYLSSEEVWGRGDGRWDGLVDEAVGRWEGRRRRVVEQWGWEVFDEVGCEVGEWVDWEGVLSSSSSSGEVEIDRDADERGTVASEWTDCGSEF